MTKYTLAILGCGAIFNRHLAAIIANQEHYKLIGVYDPDTTAIAKYHQQLSGAKIYADENQVYQDDLVNCVVILTPNSLHYTQAAKALIAGKNVILEKPATLNLKDLLALQELAKKQNLQVFTVLQVRLNPVVEVVKQALAQNLFGEIRGVSLIQRWQRPIDYFDSWRGYYSTGGGILNEFAIHYLDILQYLLGLPKAIATTKYRNKFKQIEIHDTIYSLLEFEGFGGNIEITLAAEPKNIEISLTILASDAYLKLGGKSLDVITEVEFSNMDNKLQYQQIYDQVMRTEVRKLDVGASPYHPELYKQIIENPQRFNIANTFNVIKLIEQIYA